MSAWNRIVNSNFIIKLRHWEYWPFGIVQFPLFFYYPWLSLKARSFTFFSGSNPGIVMGGMFGESKYAVLKLIPERLTPRSVLASAIRDVQSLERLMASHALSFPVILKPDIGERGFMVKKVTSVDEAAQYISEMKHDFIIQELVELPLEFGVFYSRRPSAVKGRVTSIVMKEMLYVVGDGKSTLQELIFRKPRAKLQWPALRQKFGTRIRDVIPAGMKLEIVSIGNHCLGTKFINANHLISQELSDRFDEIAKSIPGFYFGRFDLRCASIESLAKGEVKILELNGCGAEPAHIYDPDFSFFKAVVVLVKHWRTIYTIAKENKQLGFDYLPLHKAIQHYHNFKEKTRS